MSNAAMNLPTDGQEEKVGWSREEMAQRAALDIPNGSYVNLGIGIPELVARFVPEGREVIYHTENGLLGMGAVGEDGGEPELINAGKKRISAVPGAAFFHHADSFSMIRSTVDLDPNKAPHSIQAKGSSSCRMICSSALSARFRRGPASAWK